MRRGIILITIVLLILGTGCINTATEKPMDATAVMGKVDEKMSATTAPKPTTVAPTTPTPTNTPEPEVIDTSTYNGVIKSGKRVNIEGIIGILMGDIEIVNGKIEYDVSYEIIDDNGDVLRENVERDHSQLGHVEMIAFPQRGETGEVYIEIDGVDSGYVFKAGWRFEDYLAAINIPKDREQLENLNILN